MQIIHRILMDVGICRANSLVVLSCSLPLQAVVHNFTLIAHNQKDFDRIPN